MRSSSILRVVTTRLSPLALVACLILWSPAGARAVDVFWTGGEPAGDWADTSNWGAGRVPGALDVAIIDNGGTAEVSSVVSTPDDLNSVCDVRIDDGNLVIVDGGELTVFQGFVAGAFGGTGTVDHSGGVLRFDDSGDGGFHLGSASGANPGVGEYTLSGDAQLIQQPSFSTSFIGRGAGSSATLNVMGNSLMSLTNLLEIGAEGSTATVNQSGGRIEVVPELPVSFNSDPGINIGNGGGTVTYDMSDGELISPNNLNVGEGGSTVVVNQSGGTVQADYSLRILAQGTYNLSGGTLIANNAAMQDTNLRLDTTAGDWQVNEIGIGNEGELNISGTGRLIMHERTQVFGDVNQTGGELHLLAAPALAHQTDLNIGDGGTTNQYNLSGGTMNVDGAINVGLWNNNTDSHFNVSGGQVTTGSLGIGAGTDPASSQAGINKGTMTMTGGDVQVNDNLWIAVGHKAAGELNMSGGTLNSNGVIEVGTGIHWNTPDDGQFAAHGTLNLSGDAHMSGTGMRLGGRTIIDDLGTGTGVVNQTGGTLEIRGGLLEVGAGPDSTGIYNLSGGLLDMGGGDISFGGGDGEFEFTGGVIRNAANINFSLANLGGTIQPGASAGVTNINGDYFVVDAASALDIEIGGLVQGTEYDLLNITGDANLAGILNVSLIGGGGPLGDTNGDGVVNIDDLNNVRNNFGAGPPLPLGDTNGDGVVNIDDLNNVRNNFGAMGGGFLPSAGDVFEILTTVDGVTGQFDVENLPNLGPGLAWNVNYLANSVELEVLATPAAVPEPSALLLASLAALLLSMARRRRT